MTYSVLAQIMALREVAAKLNPAAEAFVVLEVAVVVVCQFGIVL